MHHRHCALAVAGLGAAALVACGGPTTLDMTPAAATTATHPVSGTTATAPPSGATPMSTRCDVGPWTGVISPEGRPDNFDAGDAGAVYVWHDGDGWHVRATDERPSDHHYTGTIALTRDAAFVDVRTVRDERDDHVTVDGDNVLHYDFHTHASIDGVDFHVSCADNGGERQVLAFHTEFDGQPVPSRVKIGDSKQSPAHADFAFRRRS